MSLNKALLCCALLLAQITPLLAQEAQREPDAPRPRIGLVLSGGGARGLAHIGVLRALETLRVPIDVVVGTSMGAVVGGAYAAGRSPAELEAFVQATDWDLVFADRPQRRNLSFTRREEDQLVPSRIELGLGRQGVSLPPAAAGNAALEHTLDQLLPAGRGEQPVAQLSLPFRALATDLLSGALLALDDEPLFTALRASMAVPGVFAPVRVKGRPLVDGGLVRNLGVDIARKLGADLIIAVNVGSPLLEERDLTSAVGVANQMLQILTEQNVSRSLQELTGRDVLIDPQLDSLGFMDFSQLAGTIEAGERSALAAHERLAALALAPEAYARWREQRLTAAGTADRAAAATAPSRPLAALQIAGTQRSNPAALRAELDLSPGAEINAADAERLAATLYGRGDFDRVDARLDEREGRHHLTLHVNESEWARSRLRLGLEFYSNFKNANRFSLVALHSVSWLNPWGAELRSIARIGARRELGSELLQPLGEGSAWYIAPRLHHQSGDAELFVQGLRLASYSASTTSAELALGRRLGNWGDVRLGLGRLRASNRILIPEPAEPAGESLSLGSRFAQLRIDSLDSMAFPSRGQMLEARIERLSAPALAEVHHQIGLLGLSAFRWQRWAGHVYGEYSHATVGSASPLGGFLRLSGTADKSLDGQTLALSRLVMARQIGRMPLGLGQAVRAGFSLELGGIVPTEQSLSIGDLKLAGSGFVAVDTRFGPFYLAAGHTRRGGSAVYLYLGPVW